MSERYQLVSADSELLNGQKTKLVNEKNELTRLISDLNNSLIQNTQEKNLLRQTSTNFVKHLNQFKRKFTQLEFVLLAKERMTKRKIQNTNLTPKKQIACRQSITMVRS